MSGFTLVTLRWYHGGVLDLSSGQVVYSGGQVTEFLDVDVDRLSYFELRGYIKELGYTTTCTFSIKPPNSGILEDIHNDMDILDLSCSLEDGDIVEVYVKHLIDDAVVDPTLILLENVPHGYMEESGSTFNKVNEQSGVGEDPFTTFDTRSASTPTPSTTTSSPRSPFTTTTHSTTTAAPKSPSTKTPPTTTAAPRSPSTTTPVTAANPSIEDADDLVSGPVESDFLEKEGSDYSTEDSVESECGLVGDDDEDYGSDVHEEVRELRAEKRSFQRRKRKERVPVDTEEVPVGEAGADLGFDETQTGKISVEGRLGGDEPYFASSDDGSFEIDEDEFSDECVESERVHLPRTVKRRRRPSNQKIIHDPTAKKVVWQLGMVFADVNEFRRAVSKYAVQKRVQIEKCVNEPKRVRCRCKEGCPWLLFACLDKTTNDFMIKTYNPKHSCNSTTRNYLCNAKFISTHFRKRINEQPNIRVFKLQELIRKKFKIHVGKTTVRRARAKVLKDIMGDHIVEFGKILDYKDELLRTNPGSTCVVKLGEPDALGRPIFQSFYICFDPLKKAFQNCRKCIGLDGCFLKGVCRGQLLVAVAKDGNNQMLPLAWAVVEYEKKETWTWFIKLLKEDLGLGDGEDLTLITDMQKGLIGAILNILPLAEHRMCARHILANWAKDWRGLQRRQQFWSIAKSTFESQLRKNVAKMKLLGPEKMMDDLMYYNIEYWCKVYFNSQVKCDSVDNNMSECFNSWILAARHKTIITMLDEIRVKMMTRIANFKKCEPLDYIDNCYSKATYLRTYANVLQPVTNMEMWPVSTNPTVAPPEIKSMPGRPGKLRKKEAGESKKSGKLPRTGLAMTCSNCNVRGHNKRGCPQRVESSTREEPSNIDKGNGKTSGLGRPKKTQTEGEHSTKRSRGRPPAAPSASPGPAKRSRGRPPAAPSASPGPAKRSRGRPLAVPSASAALTKGARGRPPNASATPAKSARGRPPAAASAPPTCPSPANYHVGSSSPADYQLTNSNKGRGRGRGSTTSYKRQTVIGMGVFQDENGFKALNPGMSSCKIFSTGTTKVTKSADVTGDIGYKPSTAPKLKWNGKAAISTSKLQEMREEQRKKSKGSSS
ncbi:hypothetical protein MTR67_053252 [Solanum verrucosum]|uniref:Transposase MuDR plant domain-containing protein n=1 Tax=Solanum verrucosum TaxID=315347 RepID=A0AAF1A0P2_SOLVR|nr:hypothetical protein MTR67_053227 [Solanum verrucosum]WMV59867.1 hypothetical protein MTR67_053252 [Solanum verrucosum]